MIHVSPDSPTLRFASVLAAAPRRTQTPLDAAPRRRSPVPGGVLICLTAFFLGVLAQTAASG